ncbi:APC family permease [Haloarcula onubensis]|uniref:APC family permease n=1 Tax=Haloarcula onubensis TaxID=2950539 RepID=A0ABU2FPM5_9EURY|nr:APC family permease [Halomicroarcula sp. S3CR25-11]MDS0282702.1 APC family permease [Halomicroarcula sp. S3CR25-11]
MSDRIGLGESVAMAVGGMVGGGIFAVLGVVAAQAGTAAWLAFLVSGVVALAAGYSFVRLNGVVDEPTGPVALVETVTGNTTLAGMIGWTFVIGYVGTMGLYAYAFGSYFVGLVGVDTVGPVPLRPLVSAGVVVVFIGINVLGAHASGRTEDTLVGLKVLILLAFCGGGLYYGATRGQLTLGIDQFGVGPAVAGAIAFVAFEGWELLLFDQESIRNPRETVKTAIFVSIPFVTALYVLVALVTTSLLPAARIQADAETALAVAAEPVFGTVGFLLIGVAALFSTASALNATLFSTARLVRQLATEDMLPSRLTTADGEPVRSLALLGALTMLLSAFGSLDAISSFASLAFVTIFGLISYLAFRYRSASRWSSAGPVLGVLGAVSTVVALCWYLATQEFGTFLVVLTLSTLVMLLELLYFERKPVERTLLE